MDTNYWKNAYKKTWDQSSQRENALIEILESATGRRITSAGLGAGTTDYISGSAQENGYEKGDADLPGERSFVHLENHILTLPLATGRGAFRDGQYFVNGSFEFHNDVLLLKN